MNGDQGARDGPVPLPNSAGTPYPALPRDVENLVSCASRSGQIARKIMAALRGRTGMVDLARCGCRGVRLGCSHPSGLGVSPVEQVAARPPVLVAPPAGPTVRGHLIGTHGDRAFVQLQHSSGWFPLSIVTLEVP